MIFTAAFLRGAAERAVKTFAQTLVAVVTAAEVVGILDVDWSGALGAAGLAAVLSLLTSIGNADFTAGAVTDRSGQELEVDDGVELADYDDADHDAPASGD